MSKETERRETAWNREFLASAEIIHFATVGEDGAPAVRPVNFLYRNGNIYIHSGPKSGKILQIQRNARVCLEATEPLTYIPAKENPCTATYSYRSVVLKGKARIIEEKAQKQVILQKIMEKYQPEGGYREVSESDTETVAVIEVSGLEISEKLHIRE